LAPRRRRIEQGLHDGIGHRGHQIRGRWNRFTQLSHKFLSSIDVARVTNNHPDGRLQLK